MPTPGSRRRLKEEHDRALADESMKGFVAAASAATGAPKIRRTVNQESWQQELWRYYDDIGEFREANIWQANSASRADLVIEKRIPGSDEWAPVPDGPAKQYLNELVDACGGQQQFLYLLLLHLGVPGESYIVGMDQLDSIGELVGYKWRICQAKEIDTGSTPPTMVDPQTLEKVILGENALIIRIWRQHPADAALADSPAKAVRSQLRKLDGLDKRTGADIDSRLAGNGILLLPNEVTLTTANGQTVDSNSDTFMQVLAEAMVTPIKDRDSAAAVVPIILRMAGEHIKEVRHLTFATEFDAQVVALIDLALRRLALGLDIPPEQLLGMGDANHWSAYQIEESTVKTSFEPPLGIIVNGLTPQFLIPLLAATGIPDAEDYRIWYDVTKLTLRPDRTGDAKYLFEKGAIGYTTLLATLGFDEADAPTFDELRKMLMIDLVRAGKIDPVTGTALGLPQTAIDKPGLQDAAPLVPPATPETKSPGAPPARPTVAPTVSPVANGATPGPGT